ncbi:MAG: hypothetical protein KIT22_12945 [Verrucomicrobiae bacterium]|nr:hypothetical protein [Verrucomicrobiae bacterium]
MMLPRSSGFAGGWRGWLATALALLLTAAGHAAVRLIEGPTVTATATNAVVRWTTDAPAGARARIQFGLSPGKLDRRAQGPVGTNHAITVDRLVPGTTYHFTVGTARIPLATNTWVTPSAGTSQPGPVAPRVVEKTGEPESARPPPARVTWGSLRTLEDHFDRHGGDFRAASAEDYAAQAWSFLVRAIREGLPAKRDDAGVIRVFDPRSGAFAAYNPDGTTKTYFKPGRRGYFQDQPGDPVDLRSLNHFHPPQ